MVQRRVPGYRLPYSVLLTRTNSAIRTRTLAHIEKGLIAAGVPVFDTELNEREAFRAMFSFRQPLAGLNPADVANVDKAIANAEDFAREVIAALRGAPAAAAGGAGMSERVNPFGDLGDFAPAPPKAKPEHQDVVDEVAAQHGFPSRQPAKPGTAPAPAVAREPPPRRQQRRYTTGRNKQINIKATDETIKRLYRLADARGVPLGVLLKQALDALENGT